jgi:hypothetical protein
MATGFHGNLSMVQLYTFLVPALPGWVRPDAPQIPLKTLNPRLEYHGIQ